MQNYQLKIKKGDAVTSVKNGELAYFEYTSIDQNDKNYAKDFQATFQVTAGFNDIVVYDAADTTKVLANIKAGNTKSVTLPTTNGVATIAVGVDEATAGKVNSSANVKVHASTDSLPVKSVAFEYGTPGQIKEGTVEAKQPRY